MDIVLTSQVLAALIAAARAAHPHEACGLLLGEQAKGAEQITQARPAANIHPAPASHFEIDPQALISAHRASRQGGPQIIGYYHSHPAGSAIPSATDQAQSARDGCIWAIIAADNSVCFWRDGKEGFAALSFGIIDG